MTMKKILISIKDNSLYFSYKSSINKEKSNLLNTNIISDNELVFSEDYINENEKIVSLFIKELCVDKDISSVIVSKNELAILILKILKKNDMVTNFSIKENCNLTYAICEELSTNKYIKYLNCFSIPTFMLEYLDKFNIKVESRNETFVTSNFMLENNLQLFSRIYYKTSIKFTPPVTEEDIEDFKTFCKINRYLKTIHLIGFDSYSIDLILEVIKYNRIRNLKIVIHDDSNKPENIEYLKKLNKRYKSKLKLTFTISYSDDYLKDNIFKQVILNTLKICGLIISCLVVGIISYVTIFNYRSMKQVAVIQNDIKKVIQKSREEQQQLNPENPEDPVNNIETDVSKYNLVNTDIASLFSINPDVYGWLKVNNTSVDYPVVHTDDNDYYLQHNLYKEKDKNGWIFMDYRNSTTSELSKNTIIYGHNMYYSGVMFGTLHKAYNKNWYNKSSNQIIEFNTLYSNMNFKIFSIYKIPKTSDYLLTDFNNDNEFMSYVNMVKSRSVNDFNVEINKDDKLLTLSTCTGNNDRLVIHAVLMK
ncbi:MAG: class B sortase [Firmicutes bacterium]|nr:class B sortase [Bacillota bacterium]